MKKCDKTAITNINNALFRCPPVSGNYYESYIYYDGLNRVIGNRSEAVSGNLTQEFFFNEFGEQNKTTIPKISGPSQYMTIDYDPVGRPEEMTNPDGSSVTYVYDRLNTTVYDENSHVIKYGKDVFGNIVTVTERNNVSADPVNKNYVTTYEYDILGNLIKIIPQNTFNQTNVMFRKDNGFYANGTPIVAESTYALRNITPGVTLDTTFRSANTTFTYDALSRKTSMSDPDLGNQSYTYNANGKLASVTDARGMTTTYSYDEIDRPEFITSPDGGIWYVYDYYTIGTLYLALVSFEGYGVAKTYQYDNRLRITQETVDIDGSNYSTNYTYDSMDRITSKTYPNNKTVTYTYNDQALLNSIYDNTTNSYIIRNISYNAQNLMTEKELGNNVNTTLTYNQTTSRLQNIRTGTLQNLTYTFDAKGNIIQIRDGVMNETQNFMYDDLDRLILACSPEYSQSFAYNPLGCIIAYRSKDNGSTEIKAGFEYGNVSSGKVSKIHAPTKLSNPNTAMTYDACGNLISDGKFLYTYDSRNHLTTVRNMTTNAVVSEFMYDDQGKRVKKTENGVTTLYISDEYEIVDGNSTVYYFANDDRIAKESSDGRYWYLVDHLGSTNVMIDSTGSLVERSLYYPFGGYRSGVADEKYGFTGKEFDSDTGLYYYGARYYNPEIFVFTQADTVIPDVYHPQALNRYSYCLNNPLKYEDPDGHYPLLATAAVGAAAGAFIFGGAEAGRQLITTGKISDGNAVVKSAVVGGVAGGVAGLTLGVGNALMAGAGLGFSLSVDGAAAAIVAVHVGAAADLAGGVTERAVDAALNGEDIDCISKAGLNGNEMVHDIGVGAVSGVVPVNSMVSKYIPPKVHPVAEIAYSAVVSNGVDHTSQRIDSSLVNHVDETDDYYRYSFIKVPKTSVVGKQISKTKNKT